MQLRTQNNLYKGVITLSSSNKHILRQIKNEIHFVLKEQAFFSKNCQTIKEAKKSKYVTIFKSPFVYKKAKDTFSFETYISTVSFSSNSLLVLKEIAIKLENYKGVVDSSIKVNTLLLESSSNVHSSLNFKFASENFKKVINF